MSMIAHLPHGRSRFASTVPQPCQHPKGLKSHRDVISSVKKGQGQSIQHNCNPPAITAVTSWGSFGGDGPWATELSATRGAPNLRYLEVTALDILLQAAYYLVNISHISLLLPSGHNAILLEWLDAYCETHQVYFLDHFNLKNNLPRQGQVPSAHLVRSDQFSHAERGKEFLVQSQAVYQHSLHWGHRGSQYHDLDNLQHPSVLACYHQAKLSHLVDKANRDINRLQESRLPQVSDCHRFRLYNLNPRRKSKHKARYERKIGFGRPCASSKVHTVPSKGIFIEYESIYLKDQDKKSLLDHEMEIDTLDKALDFKTFKSLEAKTMFHGYILLMLAKYMVKGRHYNKVEQEGELGSPQGGTCSQTDRTVQKCGAAIPQERSKTAAGKKRSRDSAGHPNDEDDLDDSGKDGDRSRKRSKKRVKESGLKFACPFFKHDPERYKTTRSCMGPGWTNVHRVKEHIFRSHCEPPFKCFRCHSAFKTEDELSDHQRQTVPCKVCVPESQDRHGLSTINADTEKRLRSRKTNKSLTEVEKWFNMYQLIFPSHSPPLSPYHSETEGLLAHFNRTIGPRFRIDLHDRLKREIPDSFLSSTMVDDIVHQAMAALTNAFLMESDIDGKDSETSINSLQAESAESSERIAVANRSDAFSFNPELPHELESLPRSMNDPVLIHSTAGDSACTGWLSTTSKPRSDSSSGTKALSSPLGSGEYINPEKASAHIIHLDSEDQLKVGTHDLEQTILREPLLPPSPDASQSTVHERPSGYSYVNSCHHDAMDSSHKYRETCQGGIQGNDSRDLFTSPSDTEIWNPFEQELAYPYEPLGSISFNAHLAD